MSDEFVLKIDTTVAPEELLARLRTYEPWGHRIEFSNGVSTAELARRTPFSDNALQKFDVAARHIPFAELRGGSMLDVGCNSGYNSIHAAASYGMEVVGIDVSRRHILVSSLLAEMAAVQAEYLLGDAETFSRPEGFDVVVHFGTLYHLKNPLLSLQTTYANLKPGGWLALETQTYDHPDDPNLCYFMHMHNNDKTNFWAISQHVLGKSLEIIGFRQPITALCVSPKGLAEHMNRVIVVARKPT